MDTISRNARRELIKALADRYRAATKADKARMLDELVAISGYHRKHAIRALRAGQDLGERAAPSPRPRVYDEAVRQALIVLWEASDRFCGKRLKPLLPLLVPSLDSSGPGGGSGSGADGPPADTARPRPLTTRVAGARISLSVSASTRRRARRLPGPWRASARPATVGAPNRTRPCRPWKSLD